MSQAAAVDRGVMVSQHVAADGGDAIIRNLSIRADLDGSNAFYFPGYAEESLSYGGRIYWSWNGARIDAAEIDGSNLQEGSIPGGSGEVNAMAVGGQ